MANVSREKGQSLDDLIKLFNKKCSNENILKDATGRMVYGSKREKRNKKINSNNQHQKVK